MNKTYRLEAEFVGGFMDAAKVEDALTQLKQAVPSFVVLRLSEYSTRKDKE